MADAWDGRPQNPERDGEHIFEVTDDHGRVWHEVWKWDARSAGGYPVWLRPNFAGPVYGYEPRDLTAPIYSNVRYAGPFHTPTEARALAQAAAEAMREALRAIRHEAGRARGEQAHRDAARAAFSIAAKALAAGHPTPDRDAIRAQARREGMEAAAREVERLREALRPFASPMMDRVQTDVRTAHQLRGNGASEAMHDDDCDLRVALRKAVGVARAALAGEGRGDG